MPLLSDLVNAYKTAWDQLTPSIGQFNAGGGTTSDALNAALNTPVSGVYVPTNSGAQQGLSSNPQIVPISDQEAADAQMQQGGSANAAIAAKRAEMLQPAAMPQSAPMQRTPSAAPLTARDSLDQSAVSNPTVATVNTDSSFPSPSDYNADGTQASGGGLLSALAGASQQAVQDPVASKGLLSSMGDFINQKLKSLSPAASQALIASGMTMLAGNDGTRNLAQLVGAGGIAGLNQYQTITQNTLANRIAQQKAMIDYNLKSQELGTNAYNAQTERFKAANAPTTVKPGEAITTPGQLASGQAPAMVGGGPNGQLPVARTEEVTDGNGNQYTQGYDIWGRPVGQPVPKTVAFSGPLNDAQQKSVNDAQTSANNSAFALTKTQNFIKQLTEFIPDPNNPGQTIRNPDYVPMPGGVTATVQNELNRITGGQTQSQMLRQQVEQNVRLAMLQGYKAGVGGRLTNTDVNLLQKGMPPDNASGQALLQYLQAYAHLQEDQATHDTYNAQYIAANRGDMGPLHSAQTIGGIQYPAGTTMAQVLSRQAPVQSQNGNPSAQQAQAVIAQAQAAARAGDAKAQQALKQRGLNW